LHSIQRLKFLFKKGLEKFFFSSYLVWLKEIAQLLTISLKSPSVEIHQRTRCIIFIAKDENIVIEQEEFNIIIMWNEEKKIDSVDYESLDFQRGRKFDFLPL
jgi:hypothetical protein